MKGTEHFTRTIAEYLNQRAMTDPLFAPNLLKPNKNIEECITYILSNDKKITWYFFLSLHETI